MSSLAVVPCSKVKCAAASCSNSDRIFAPPPLRGTQSPVGGTAPRSPEGLEAEAKTCDGQHRPPLAFGGKGGQVQLALPRHIVPAARSRSKAAQALEQHGHHP